MEIKSVNKSRQPPNYPTIELFVECPELRLWNILSDRLKYYILKLYKL